MGKLFTFFIIALWAISTYFEWKRKRDKAQKRRQAIEAENKKRSLSQGASPDYRQLEKAEEQVRDAPYQPTGSGADLQIRSEDISNFIKETFDIPSIKDQEEPLLEEDNLVTLGEYLEQKESDRGSVDLDKASYRQKGKPFETAPKELLTGPKYRKVNVLPNFEGDQLTRLFVASEILQPPVSKRRGARSVR